MLVPEVSLVRELPWRDVAALDRDQGRRTRQCTETIRYFTNAVRFVRLRTSKREIDMTKTAQAARDFFRYGTQKALDEYRAALEQQIAANRQAKR